MIRIRIIAVAAALAGGIFAANAAAQDVMVVYDASGSMWGQIEGVTKIEIAREVLGDLVEQWQPETNIGLVAYGHRREADCSDIETVIAPQSISPASFTTAVNAINPLGRTPLSAAVEHAAEELIYLENPATVVLISDGIENCSADPCALATHLEERGIDFTTHVIGFDVSSEEYAQLSCIAENTGGTFVPAANADELADALNSVKQVIEQAPEPLATPQPASEPEPRPEVSPVGVKAPATAVVGTTFTVAWEPTLDPSDYLTIVPVDTQGGEYGDFFTVHDLTEGTLVAPAEPGLYEVRYVFEATDETAGSAPVEVVDAQLTLNAPESVARGADFDVTWSQLLNPDDWITIVPVGGQAADNLDYATIYDNQSVSLTAPGEPGSYEVLYVLSEDERTMASRPIEVVEAGQKITAPDTVNIGARIDVIWGQTINQDDWISIVAAGAEEGSYLNYATVYDNASVSLTAPAEPGTYEVRYVLNENGETLASAPLEVVDVAQEVFAPASVSAEGDIPVTWDVTIHENDWIAIVAAGADEGAYINYATIYDNESITLSAPSEPGLYEVRYVLYANNGTLASAQVEVVAAPGKPASD